MAIETRRARKIVLRAVTPKHYEKKAAGAFKPGHLVIETSDGEVLAQNVAGAHASFVAKEDTFQGKTIDDAYADGDVAMLHAIQPGDGLQLRVAIGAPAIVKGDPLVAAADGTVLKGAPTALLQYSSIAESAEHENTTDAADFERVAPLFGEAFARARPAATAMVVGLVDPRMRIEIEVDARIPAAPSPPAPTPFDWGPTSGI